MPTAHPAREWRLQMLAARSGHLVTLDRGITFAAARGATAEHLVTI
jgi:hypothetical protein